MPATYGIRIERRALKALAALPKRDLARVRKAVDGLAEEPRPQGARKLTGREEIYRMRIRPYRTIYKVHDRDRLVLVVKFGARKDVYRKPRGQ